MIEFLPLSKARRTLVNSLKNKYSRDETHLFMAEGLKICQEILSSDIIIQYVVLKNNCSENSQLLAKKFDKLGIEVYSCTEEVFCRIADSQSPQDIIAIAEIPQTHLQNSDSHILLDGISDPGNLGTIIRTADWFGVNSFLLTPNCADAYNPKTVRSSMGSVFRSNVIRAENVRDFITENMPHHHIYGAVLDGSEVLERVKPQAPYILVMGNESRGISEELKTIVNTAFRIEGNGRAESLNVAVAFGIAMNHFNKSA